MKKQNKNVSDSTILRRKAENLLNNKPLKAGTQMNEPEIPRLLHELQVHQVELEMQNEELRNAKDKVEITSRRYTELYDLAPTGYFTLLDNGEIVEINLSGAKLIGKNRSALINSNFKLFLSTTSLPVFNLFLQKIIDLKTKQTCEVVLSPFENRSVYVYLSGIPDNKVDQYFITAVDISEKKRVEEALKVSEEYNRAFILQTAMDGFWIVDVQGKLQEVNETYCRMSGYSEQELLLMNISELEHVDSKDDIIVHLQKIRNRGEDRFESRHRRKDGTIFDVEINVHYQAINGGRFVTFLHDITNRKQKEEEMRQSEVRYKSLFQNSNIVYLLIDPENGEIKDANAAALQFYGWSHTEICRKNIFDINILSQQEVADEMQRAKDEKQNYFVFKHRLANGTICKVEVYSGPIQYSNKTYLYSVIHDITEKTRMEKAFIESEMKFRKYIDNAPHGVFVTNEMGEYLDVNVAACKITGYSKDELLAMKIIDLVSKESIGDAIRHFVKLSKEDFAKGDFQFLKKDKSTGYWSVDAVKLSDNLFLGFVVDITERKQAEETLKQSEESIKHKLQSILSPEGSIADLELNDIIDVPSIQKLMDSFYELAQIPMAIIDKNGKKLVGVGWQDICTKFHRVHPKACRNCFESDVHLTKGIPDGEFMLYKCKNNMWDMATPITIGGEHKGNLYMGQFFFDDNPVDIEIFRKQAVEYNFNERAYLEALSRVPRLNRNKLKYAKEFFLDFAHSISKLSYTNIKLARAIEQQKKDEISLRASETRFKNLIWNLQVGVLLHGPQSEILMSNPKAIEMLGFSEDQLLGQQPYNSNWDVLNEDGIPFQQSELPLSRAVSTRLSVRNTVVGVNNPIKKQIVWLLIHVVPQLNPDGTVHQIVSTFIDITNRKKAENDLKKLNEELENRVAERTKELLKSNEEIKLAEEKYRTIADYNYDWETWLGTDGKYIYVSPSCLRITGYSVEDFMSDQNLYSNIVHPDDREMVKNHHDDTRKDGEPNSSMDFRIITRDGEERWISHSCQPVYNSEGAWLGQRGRNSDITERKKAESFLVNSQDKLRALTQHMNELAENERKAIAREIHDELGHMLTALKYDIDSLMNNSELTVEQVNNELPTMISMVESLIESVRKIATELRPGVLDHLGLIPAMEWQINQFRMMTKMKCIFTAPDDLDVEFNKNETTHIFRLLQEMLTNVARHSKANKVEISAQKENDLFVMVVKDNGKGFMVADKIQSGSLGLMGMNERALSIGAELRIDSTPGKGTSITFLLGKK